MKAFPSTDLKRNTGRVLDAVQRESIVSITNRNRETMVMMSHQFFTDLITGGMYPHAFEKEVLEKIYKEHLANCKECEQ